MTSKTKTFRCHYCNKPGQFKKDCEELAAKMKGQSKPTMLGKKKKTRMGAFKVTITAEDESMEG